MKVYAHYLWSERDKFQYRWEHSFNLETLGM